MGTKTAIEWADHTASPWYGCSKVHAGCEHCYAEALSLRNPSTLGVWGPDGVRIKSKSFIASLRKWNAEGEKAGRVQSVFPSLCDPFEDRPELVPWRREMFEAIDELPWVRLLLLTKRPENVEAMWLRLTQYMGTSPCLASDFYRPNVWLGTSISDQATADQYIAELSVLDDLSPLRFLSVEPLLGPVCFHMRTKPPYGSALKEARIGWVIIGGESGPHARPCEVEWIASIVEQCRAAGVPCFVKQDYGPKPGLQGRIPDDLWRVKEFPSVGA